MRASNKELKAILILSTSHRIGAVGIIIIKKYIKLAHERSYIKRTFRETLRIRL